MSSRPFRLLSGTRGSPGGLVQDGTFGSEKAAVERARKDLRDLMRYSHASSVYIVVEGPGVRRRFQLEGTHAHGFDVVEVSR